MVKTPHVNVTLQPDFYSLHLLDFSALITVSLPYVFLQSALYMKIPQECRGVCLLVSAYMHAVRVCPGCITPTTLRDEAFPPMRKASQTTAQTNI